MLHTRCSHGYIYFSQINARGSAGVLGVSEVFDKVNHFVPYTAVTKIYIRNFFDILMRCYSKCYEQVRLYKLMSEKFEIVAGVTYSGVLSSTFGH